MGTPFESGVADSWTNEGADALSVLDVEALVVCSGAADKAEVVRALTPMLSLRAYTSVDGDANVIEDAPYYGSEDDSEMIDDRGPRRLRDGQAPHIQWQLATSIGLVWETRNVIVATPRLLPGITETANPKRSLPVCCIPCCVAVLAISGKVLPMSPAMVLPRDLGFGQHSPLPST